MQCMRWTLYSKDIPTAFLQGEFLEEVKTTDGSKREAVVRPPPDAWNLLPRSAWPCSSFDPLAFFWYLLKAVYGLKDAPRLWMMALARILTAASWVTSAFDEQVFLRRGKDGSLIGILSAHVDDLGFAAEPAIADEVCQLLRKEYGKHSEVMLQEKYFKPLGYIYEEHSDGS